MFPGTEMKLFPYSFLYCFLAFLEAMSDTWSSLSRQEGAAQPRRETSITQAETQAHALALQGMPGQHQPHETGMAPIIVSQQERLS